MENLEDKSPRAITAQDREELVERFKRIDALLQNIDELHDAVNKIMSLTNLLLIINITYVAMQISIGRPWKAARYAVALAPGIFTIAGCANELTRRKNDSATLRGVHDAIQIGSSVCQALSGGALALASTSASDPVSTAFGLGAIVVGGLGALSFSAKMLGRRMDKKAQQKPPKVRL